MADDPKQRHGQDRTRVDIEQDHELRYWTQELGVTEEELREAVRQVGTNVDSVRQHLAGSRA